jgi:hypothetical protein
MWKLGLPELFVIALIGLMVFSMRAKPLGDLPYCWGTWLGISNGLFGLAFLLVSFFVPTAVSGSNLFAAILFVGPFALVSFGLLRRRRFGVVAFFVVNLLFCVIGVLLDWSHHASALEPYDPMQALLILIPSAIFLGANWSYFDKRWKFMSKDDRQTTMEPEQAEHEVKERIDDEPEDSAPTEVVEVRPVFCVECGSTTDANWKLCPQCGTPIEQVGRVVNKVNTSKVEKIRPAFCVECGLSTEPAWKLCPQCGALSMLTGSPPYQPANNQVGRRQVPGC